MQLFSADYPQKVEKTPAEFMFHNLAYRQTVYKTGPTTVVCLSPKLTFP